MPDLTDSQLIDRDIKAYEAQKAELEAAHFGKIVVFHGGEFIGAYDSLIPAVDVAVRRFGRGPYLIREVGTRTGRPRRFSERWRMAHVAS